MQCNAQCIMHCITKTYICIGHQLLIFGYVYVYARLKSFKDF